MKMSVTDRSPTNEGLKVVDLNFDPSFFQPQAEVLAGAIGQDEEQAAGLSGAKEQGYVHRVTWLVIQ